ncbi:MAG: FliM/FliN family flagellar motor switch protein [Rhodoferax sp.]|nr:FliM/FliN family flagellar motor switch protein [Rhodoferax sp.]
MAIDESTAEDDGMADWAEALLEQKSSDSGATAPAPGGVLSGETSKAYSGGSDAQINDINRVLDIPVLLSVELGRTKVPIKHILQLGQGSVVELDALAGEPMDVLVNGYLIAQVTPSERLRRVSKS